MKQDRRKKQQQKNGVETTSSYNIHVLSLLSFIFNFVVLHFKAWWISKKITKKKSIWGILVLEIFVFLNIFLCVVDSFCGLKNWTKNFSLIVGWNEKYKPSTVWCFSNALRLFGLWSLFSWSFTVSAMLNSVFIFFYGKHSFLQLIFGFSFQL